MPMRRRIASALAALSASALVGCGQSVSAVGKAARSLPLASVNGVDISLLAAPDARRAPGDTLALVDRAQLETLIDSQLLQEEAVRNKLDRNPLVLQAIERGRTDILAQAHLQSKFALMAAPTGAEIGAYFADHPELFAGRKFFYIKELVLDSKDFTPQLQRQVDRAGSIGEVARWLDARQVPYQTAQLARSSAELAPEMLARLETMRKFQLFVVKAGPKTMLDALHDITPDPVTAAAAAPQIDAFLRNRQRKQVGEQEILRLRKLATIDYYNQQQALAPPPATPSPQNNKEKP
jgi:peptidyl-prolyl cis-trans isomerase C